VACAVALAIPNGDHRFSDFRHLAIANEARALAQSFPIRHENLHRKVVSAGKGYAQAIHSA